MVQLITEDIRRASIPVRYEESVEIVGTVRSGANLRVLGDVAVYGNVEDAEMEVEGDMIIDGGYLGNGDGRIRCRGDFAARFIQGQQLVAQGNVKIERAILSSIVFSCGEVIVGDGEGSVIGGEVHAYGGVVAGTLGSERPVTTKIEVGVDPLVAVAIAELEAEALELTRVRLGLVKDLVTLAKDKVDSASDRIIDMEAAAEAIQGDIIDTGEKILALRRNAELNPDAVVTATRATYPPLEVLIGLAKLINDTATGPMTFRLLDDKVILDRPGKE
jgi:uncharacterized protein (DUF342 family)